MPIGMCPLCQDEKQLVDSHFIPAAIYKPLRAERFPIKDPMIMTQDLASQTSRQITAHVFCSRCEERFNEGGETWVVGKLATRDGFLIRNMVLSSRPIGEGSGIVVYSSKQIPSFRPEMLAHFAMGIFWKASVCRWKARGKLVEKLAFGAYSGRIREFLLGVKPFPAHMALTVQVDASAKPFLGFHLPMSKKWNGVRMFHWYVNGVLFILNVGRGIPEEDRQSSIMSAPDNPIFLVPGLSDKISQMIKQFSPKRVSRNLLSAYRNAKELG